MTLTRSAPLAKIFCWVYCLLTLYLPAFIVLSGKALEDLRSSLFNELRSSEGARRYQQRICGPFVALTFNFLVSVGIILMNKLVYSRLWHILLLCLQFMVSHPDIYHLYISLHLDYAGSWEGWLQLSHIAYIYSLCSKLVFNGYSKSSIYAPCASCKSISFLFVIRSWCSHVPLYWSC